MLERIKELGPWLMAQVPQQVRRPKIRMNYIKTHYLYLISMSLVGSIILYGASFIPYIDALFFAVGSATQSGLNTIDLNEMYLYQQVTMMLIASVCNPIFINTVVVFVRLYWFEKRFENVVREARQLRRHGRTITRTKSQMKEDPDVDEIERNVNGHNIRVLHDLTLPNGMNGTKTNPEEAEKSTEKMGLHTDEHSVEPTPEGSNKSSDLDEDTTLQLNTSRNAGEQPTSPITPASEHHLGLNPKLHHREIAFADEVPTVEKVDSDEERAPEQQEVSRHIEFLERQQRNAKESTALRIPGPHAFDRGELPKELQDAEGDALQRPTTRNTLQPIKSESSREGMHTDGSGELNGDDHPERSGIKFDDQQHPGHRQDGETVDRATSQGSRFSLNRLRSGTGLRQRQNTSHRLNLSEAKTSMGRTFSTLATVKTKDPKMSDPMPYLSWQATTGRNSAFLGLTQEQREELGGIEYRALKLLAKILVMYYVGFHLFGLVFNLPWIYLRQHWKAVVVNAGVDPGWWAVFTSASMFNDLGFTLTADSMLSFQRAIMILLIGSFLIIIGNTGFPVMLRFVIWVASLFTPRGTALWEELRFLLDHPRRCFTLLFPSKATWWLAGILLLLNGLDLIFFIILDLNDPTVTDLPPGIRVLDGWFQAASTRTAGFSVVSIAELHPAIQVSYLVMMYISVLPIAISVRRTNVYEEKSLGIFAGDDADVSTEDPSYIGQHLRRQLSFDLWYVFLGMFIIAIVEGHRLSNTNEYAFTMFSVLFEIISAYGTVGLSLGYPGINASFSAEFKIISKLVICAMMLRGRHRGLPYALDRAILLPSEQLQKKEAEDADRRHHRRNSMHVEPAYGAQTMQQGATYNSEDVDEQDMAKSDQPTSPVGVGIDHSSPERRPFRRTTSRLSATSNSNNGIRRRERSRSFGRIIVGGLSAGPSIPRHD